MKETYPYLVYSLAIIFLLMIAGCVAPPTETPTTPVDLYNPNQFTTKATSTSSSFVSEVTIADYTPSTTKPSEYVTFAPTTQIPSDITCRIHSINLFGYNGTAFIFDLKNPPMYINYSVIPKNVTRNEVYIYNYGEYKDKKGGWRTVTFEDYSPSSWFEITVRNNETKEIYLQDGFGEHKGYTRYLSHTLKVMNSGDLLVEFRGNDITASASIWVKPLGNFDESRLSEFTNCLYWDAHRDTLVTPIPTSIKGAIYTWNPENQTHE
jgi:hypothetical protein